MSSRLFLLWSAHRGDDGTWIDASDGPCLAFDPQGAQLAVRRGVEPIVADELLDWDTRSKIELRVASLLSELRVTQADRYRISNMSLVDAAEYELRFEWTTILCAHAAAQALGRTREPPTIVAQPGTPSAVIAGVAAGVRATTDRGVPWRPVIQPPPDRRVARLVADAVVAARAATTANGTIQLLVLPAQRTISALAPLGRGEARELGLAVAPFPGLTHGDPLRLVLRNGFPAFFPGGRPTGSRQPDPLGQVGVEPAALDAALRAAADYVFRTAAPRLAAAAPALESMERLPALRALLLPTTALGIARVVRDWAVARRLRVGVVQHGIYGFRDWDGGDRLADLILGWGPGVVEQVSYWAPRPRVEVVGTPGLLATAPGRPPAGGVQRLLVATTHPNTGTALSLWGFRWAFLKSLRAGAAILSEAGFEIALRRHPSEPRDVYAAILEGLAMAPMSEAPPGEFGEVAIGYDAVVTPYSSVAVECAALGVPVLLWTGQAPLEIRRRFLLPPLSEDLPASFANEDEFGSLAERAVADPAAFLAEARSLSERLAPYARPLDTKCVVMALHSLTE